MVLCLSCCCLCSFFLPNGAVGRLQSVIAASPGHTHFCYDITCRKTSIPRLDLAAKTSCLVVQSVTCLTADMCLTADPGVFDPCPVPYFRED